MMFQPKGSRSSLVSVPGAVGGYEFGVRRLTGTDDLSTRVDEGLDDRMVDSLVFRLDVEGLPVEVDIGVESGDHLSVKLGSLRPGCQETRRVARPIRW
jgi:hypothetical protein